MQGRREREKEWRRSATAKRERSQRGKGKRREGKKKKRQEGKKETSNVFFRRLTSGRLNALKKAKAPKKSFNTSSC